MQFALVPAGDFLMGSPASEVGREAQEVQHSVHISHPFYVGRYEVTQRQWQRVMGSNPSWFQRCGPDCPVERVNWYEIQTFVARLNRGLAPPLRLPTEAEWEYACRAGTTMPFHMGANLTTSEANYDGGGPYPGFPKGEFRRTPVKVGTFPPNAFGLYDMHGNVWEWMEDWHCPYPAGPATDPLGGKCATTFKVIRGGSWYFGADSARCAFRYTHRPQDRGFSLGFRLVRDAG